MIRTEENVVVGADPECRGVCYQAYQILRFAFTVAPIIAGIDKFFNGLTVWEQYLSQPFNVFGNPVTTMYVVGVIEIIAGIGVWLKPKIFAYIVSLWLVGIIINLLIQKNFYDIALRDLGLALGAFALGRLSHKYDHPVHHLVKTTPNATNPTITNDPNPRV